MVLALPDIALSASFLQLKQNFLNHLITVVWPIVPSPLVTIMYELEDSTQITSTQTLFLYML